MLDSLLEKLAKLEHEQWIHWMNYQNKKVGHITDMTVDEWYKQQETWQRWMRLAKTPYNKLTEKEKESDRKWARKVLLTIELDYVCVPRKQLRKMAHKVLGSIKPSDEFCKGVIYIVEKLLESEKK